MIKNKQSEKERGRMRTLRGDYKKYYQEHKERRKQDTLEYYQKHKARILKKNKLYLRKYNQLPRVKMKRKLDDLINREKLNTKRKTISKFGSAKKYYCLLCEPKLPATNWHHHTIPYKFNQAIPLCKYHHSKFHFNRRVNCGT